MKKMIIALAIMCVALPSFGSVVFESDFDGTSGLFVTNSNSQADFGADYNPDTGRVQFSDGKNPQAGLISASASDASAETGFRLTWTVDTITELSEIRYNGWFFGAQDTDEILWNKPGEAVNSVGITLLADGTGYNNGIDLVYNDNGTRVAQSLGSLSQSDITGAFTIELTVNNDDTVWVKTTGLADGKNIDTASSVTNGMYTAIADNLFSSSSAQINRGTVDVTYGSMSLETIPEPATLGLIAMAATGLFAFLDFGS